MMVGVTAALLVTVWGGTQYPWGSPVILAMGLVSAVLHRRLRRLGALRGRADPPSRPSSGSGVFRTSSTVSFLLSMVMFGAIIYLPLYLQLVDGVSPTVSGLLMVPLMLGLLATSIGSGQIVTRTGVYKPMPIIGSFLVIIGMWLLSHLGLHTSHLTMSLYVIVLGAGMGMTMQIMVLATQNARAADSIGTGTAAVTFFRSLGGAFGTSLFGAIFIAGLEPLDPRAGARGGGRRHPRQRQLRHEPGRPARVPAARPARDPRVVRPVVALRVPGRRAHRRRHAGGDPLPQAAAATVDLRPGAAQRGSGHVDGRGRERLTPRPTRAARRSRGRVDRLGGSGPTRLDRVITWTSAIFTEPQQGASYDDLLAVAQAAERLGFDAFFRSDHYLAMGDVDGLPGPTDAWITLAGIARETSTIRLGTLMTAATFRLPGPLAIAVAQVDAMSGGRVELGHRRRPGTTPSTPPTASPSLPWENASSAWRSSSPSSPACGRHPTAPPSPSTGTHYHVGGQPGPAEAGAAAGAPRDHRRFGTGAHPPAGCHATPPSSTWASSHPRTRPTSSTWSAAACRAADRDPGTLVLSAAQTVCCGTTESDIARRAAAIGREVDELEVNGLCGTPEEVVDKLGRFASIGVSRAYLQVLDLADFDHLALLGEAVLPRVAGL